MAEVKQFDTLIMTTPADFKRLQNLYPRLADSLPAGKLLFVGSSEVVRLVAGAGYGARVSAVNEDDILPFDNVHACMTEHMSELLAGRELPRGVTGWYYQQFLKWAYASQCEDDYYMTWDGDTIPCRPVSMFKEETGEPFLDLKHEYHAEYFETMGKLVAGLEKLIERSFISEHMLFRCDIVRELIAAIEGNDTIPGTTFWEKILHAIPADQIQSSAFSEFETYGTYVALKHASAYRLREWHSFRLGGEFFNPDTISDRDVQWLGTDFDAISFEKNMSVREDHRNLFDNPRYQEKLTPRQMLEAAQKEFRDGYLEVWDIAAPAGKTGTPKGNLQGNRIAQTDRTETWPGKLRYLQPGTWKVYAELGEALLDVNVNQAYLCYENALFLYEEPVRHNPPAPDDTTVRGSLESVLRMLRDSGEVFVRPVEILILSYNQMYLMQKCLESIRTHCNPEAVHVTVLDNASTDGVREWLKEQEDISLLLSDGNMGFPAGCNEAFRAVPPDRDVLLLNNDTRMTPNALFWLRMGLYETDDTGAAGCTANYTDPSQRVDIVFDLPEDYVKYGAKMNVPADDATEVRDKLSGFALLLKRTALDKTGLFDEAFSPGYFEDTDLCLRMRDAGYNLRLCKNSFIYHAGSQSFAQKSDEEIEALFTRNYHILCDKWGEETVAALFPAEAGSGTTDTPPGVSGTEEVAAGSIRPADIRLVIWDLDDTFWHGTVSEEGVTLNEDAVKLARMLPDLGIQNSICSKNDFEPVKQALEHSPQGNLWELFVFPSVNWDAKGARVKQIIEDMGLRAGNVLFIDDSDFNLREVKATVPDMMCEKPEVVPALLRAFTDAGMPVPPQKPEASSGTGTVSAGPDAACAIYKKLIPARLTFPDGSEIITDADRKRLEHYRVLETKREERQHAGSNEQFLVDSEIRVTIDHDCMPQIDRIAELVARTNQLNYTKRRDTKEELEMLIASDSHSCAMISVADKYGDYGIAGFYAVDLAENTLVHFLFSCRTLGMGVEQYVYQELGYPSLDVRGDIAAPLEKREAVTWIRQADETKKDSVFQSTREPSPCSSAGKPMSCFIKGPCDMDQMVPFLQQMTDAQLYLETNFVDERGVIVAGNNNLLHLKEAREYTREEILKNIEAAPFLSIDDFETKMFSPEFDVVFFSMLSETHTGIYRHKKTGFRICFGSCNFDLTDPEHAAKYISGEYPNHNFPFTEEVLKCFRETFVFEGRQSAEETAELAVWLRDALPETTGLVLLLGSETEAEPNTEEFADHAPAYRAANELLRAKFVYTAEAAKDRTQLLPVTDFITGRDCFAGCTNHFSRKVYRDLAATFLAIQPLNRARGIISG